MSDIHPPKPLPETPDPGRLDAESAARTSSGLLVMGERAAGNLIRTASRADGVVVDLDDDPTLRAAAQAGGRHYLAVDLTVVDGPPERQANLVVVRWPRPGDPSWLSSAGEVLAGVRGLLAPMGQVAVLLDPTPALAYGITWTGTLLAAASNAGLPVLQDVVCVHDVDPEDASQAGSPAPVTLRHRVILVLETVRARHAQH